MSDRKQDLARQQHKLEDHDCLDNLTDLPADPLLPDHIVKYECDLCGRWFDFDTETGEHTVDR